MDYLRRAVSLNYYNRLKFWKEKEATYPRMVDVAKYILAIQATNTVIVMPIFLPADVIYSHQRAVKYTDKYAADKYVHQRRRKYRDNDVDN